MTGESYFAEVSSLTKFIKKGTLIFSPAAYETILCILTANQGGIDFLLLTFYFTTLSGLILKGIDSLAFTWCRCLKSIKTMDRLIMIFFKEKRSITMSQLLEKFIPNIHTFQSATNIGVIFQGAAIGIAHFSKSYIYTYRECSGNSISCFYFPL